MSDLSVNSINERAAEEFCRKGGGGRDGREPRRRPIEFFERALNENPDHEQACFKLALMYDRRAEDAKAIELYERIWHQPSRCTSTRC